MGAHLELSVQIVDQCVHILAEGVVLLHADEVGDKWVSYSSMLALPGCPVGQLCAHGGDGVEPRLQKLWIQAVGNGPASGWEIAAAATRDRTRVGIALLAP